MSLTVPTRRPQVCALVRSYAPYLLFDSLVDQAYIVKVKYVSKNPGRSADGLTEVSAIDARDQLPNLPSQYHELVFLKTVEMIATDMAMQMDGDGNPKFPGVDRILQIFSEKYEQQLGRDLAEGRRKIITRGQVGFDFAGAERVWPSYYQNV